MLEISQVIRQLVIFQNNTVIFQINLGILQKSPAMLSFLSKIKTKLQTFKKVIYMNFGAARSGSHAL